MVTEPLDDLDILLSRAPDDVQDVYERVANKSLRRGFLPAVAPRMSSEGKREGTDRNHPLPLQLLTRAIAVAGQWHVVAFNGLPIGRTSARKNPPGWTVVS